MEVIIGQPNDTSKKETFSMDSLVNYFVIMKKTMVFLFKEFIK